MPRQVHVIGIGMGTPAHLTQRAIAAMRDCDVFLVADKGPTKGDQTQDDMVTARQAVCDAVCEPGGFEFITVPDPDRPSDGETDKTRYREGVTGWRNARAHANAAIMGQLPPDQVVGFLAWGDPAFYDSTIRMVEEIAQHLDIVWDVIPGLAAFQILAAEAGVGLNEIGASVHITPGRKLVEEYRPGLGTVVVMLDSYVTVRGLVERYPDAYVIWGAYLGLAQQTIIRGPLARVIVDIIATRARLRDENGWLMDTYALWPPGQEPSNGSTARG